MAETKGVINGVMVDVEEVRSAVGQLIKAVTLQEPDDWTYDISGKNLADLNLMELTMAMSEIAGYGERVDKHRITDKNRRKKFPLFYSLWLTKKANGL